VGVEVREAHAVPGQRVDVGRLDLAAERADVGVAQVVAEDDDDVRPLRLGVRGDSQRRKRDQQGSKNDGKGFFHD
jgi:hypothetical protein